MLGLAVINEIVYPLKGIQTTTKRKVYMMQEQGIYCVQTVSCWLLPLFPGHVGGSSPCVAWETRLAGYQSHCTSPSCSLPFFMSCRVEG